MGYHQAGQTQNGNKKKCLEILLAEDNASHAKLIMRNLNEMNTSVVHFLDGEKVLNYLNNENLFTQQQPCLLLLDLRLPRIDGLEVLRTIKQDERINALPVVILSSSNDPLDVTRAYEYGANSYLVKPIDFDEMGTLLKEATNYWTNLNTPP